MAVPFRYGDKLAELTPPEGLPDIIETAEGWDNFRSFRRMLASQLAVSDFGCEKIADGSFIVFPLEKDAKPKPEPNELQKFLSSFEVFSEKSAKSAELFELLAKQKKKYAESDEFLKASKLGMMRLVAQMVVLRREALSQTTLSQALANRVIPIKAMGELESSTTTVNLAESLDFLVQQGLALLGAQRLYDDLLAFWADLSPEEKKTRDIAGAAPFWAAQQERFTELTHSLRAWPQFGSAPDLRNPALKKDSLISLGREALTDTKVQFLERQLVIKNAYHTSFKQQQKHAALCQAATPRGPPATKKRRFSQVGGGAITVPVAPKPKSAFISIPPAASAPRVLFSPGRAPPKNRRKPHPAGQPKKPTECYRCHKVGHTAKNCHSKV